jgi:predicted nucleic acid-binding protein
MIAVDTNLLVYAHREDSPWHDTALVKIRCAGWIGGEIVTFRDFSRFPTLTVINPLVR